MSIRPLRSCLYALKPIASVPRLAPLAVYSPRAATPTLWTRMFATSRRRDASGAKTFSNQNKLPRLPVPDLEKSLEGYVRSLIPVLEQTYGPNDLPKEIEKRKLFARDFASKGGMGRVLQERLRDLDHVSPNNWLDDTLWLPLAYHTWREPLLVNSNYWILFSPHPSDPLPPTHSAATDKPAIGNPDHNPSQAASSGSQGGGAEWIKANGAPAKGKSWDEAVSKEWITEYQVRKAAWVLSRFAQFRQMVADETLPPDASKAGPYCMSQYSKLFNFSRIPLPGTDAFSTIAPNATHATVIIDEFIYSIEVFEKPPSVDDVPAPLPLVVIEANIQAAVKDARKRLEAGEKAKAVGVLTADHRDTWARNREYLLSVSSENRAALESISTSLLALCLDPYTLPSLPTEDPLVNPTVDAQLRNGVGGIDGGRNRWYDKGVSIAVETNGRTSFSGEHSPIDALIPAITIEYVNGTPIDLAAFEGKSGGNGAFSRIDFVVDEQLEQEIKACAKRNQTILDDSDASQLWFGEYGVDWIKKHGKSGAKKEVDLKVDGFLAKISPDAYIQQALQLAWYKDQGYASATYETASTRAMKHGRTDVIRTLSVESRSFVKSMLDANSTDSTRYTALVEACKVHAELTRRSSSGHGWDRHLMGLRVMLRPGETHPLFEDDCYAKSQEWKLSTSGLSAGTKFTGTGFGTAFPNGLGTNYLAGAFLLKFGIETKWSCKETSTARFKHHLVQSLRDMRGVVESAGSVSAKL